jgi:hypothetical protein
LLARVFGAWASVGGAVLMGLAVGMAGGGSVGAGVGVGCIAAINRRHPINTQERVNTNSKNVLR